MFAYGSWDAEYGYVYLDSDTTPIYTYGPQVLNMVHDRFCYMSSWGDADIFTTANVVATHTSSTLKVRIKSGVD